MKNYQKMITILLTAAVLLTAIFMTGCTRLTEVKDDTAPEPDAPAAGGDGVYVRLTRDDAYAVYLQGDNFSKVCKNADGTALQAGEWFFTGDDIAQRAAEKNCSILFTVGALAADETQLAEDTFLYDAAQGKLYVTISGDGVTCATSDAADAPVDVPSVLTLPILDEIDADVAVGTAGASLTAVQAAASLLDWGASTGLDAEEIGEAVSTWLAAKNDRLEECLQKMAMVDDACQKLLTADARELLDSAGCADVDITWGSQPSAAVEAVMQAAGLRG